MITHKFREVEAFATRSRCCAEARGGRRRVARPATETWRDDDRRHAVVRPSSAHNRARAARRSRWPGSSPRTTRAGGRSTGSISRSRPARSSASPACPATAKRACRGAVRAASPSRVASVLIQRPAVRAQTRPFRPLQGLRPARGAAEERHGAAHDGRREYGVSPFDKAADDASRLVAVARADARHGARPDQPLQCQDAVDRDPDRDLRAAMCSAPCWRASCPATSTC